MQRPFAAELQSRVILETDGTAVGFNAVVEMAQRETGANLRNSEDLVVVSRSKIEGDNHLGDAADAIIAGVVKASLLVVQARSSGLDSWNKCEAC